MRVIKLVSFGLQVQISACEETCQATHRLNMSLETLLMGFWAFNKTQGRLSNSTGRGRTWSSMPTHPPILRSVSGHPRCKIRTLPDEEVFHLDLWLSGAEWSSGFAMPWWLGGWKRTSGLTNTIDY